MPNLLLLPREILDSILELLPVHTLSQCAQCCKALRVYAEPKLYSQFSFTSTRSKNKGVPSSEAIEARPLRLLYRTLITKPRLGLHLQSLQYSGPSHRLSSRVLREHTRADKRQRQTRDRQDWVDLTAVQAVERVLSLYFRDDELNQLWSFTSDLKAMITEHGGNAKTDWPFPDTVFHQGLTLCMLEAIILLAPKLQSVSVVIDADYEYRSAWRLHSVRMASLAALHSGATVRPLSTLSNLSKFEFGLTHVAYSDADSALNVQDITDMLAIAPLQNVSVAFVGREVCVWADEKPRLDFLKSLVLSPTPPNVANLKSWLSTMPNILSLQYRINLEMNIEDCCRIDGSGIEQALTHCHSSLEHLEMWYDTIYSNHPDPAGEFNDSGVQSSIGSLASFSRLRKLAISLTMILGRSATKAPSLATVLPPDLERVCLIDDSYGHGYHWETQDVQRLSKRFLDSVSHTHPHLTYYHLISYLDETNMNPSERAEYDDLVGSCRTRSLVVIYSSVITWDRYSAFEQGIFNH